MVGVVGYAITRRMTILSGPLTRPRSADARIGRATNADITEADGSAD